MVVHDNASKSTTNTTNIAEEDEYGVLKKPNIKTVVFGDLEIVPWYGNAAYFDAKYSKSSLGIDIDTNRSTGKSSNGSKQVPKSQNSPTPTTNGGTGGGDNNDHFWLDRLFVCEYCFKYTAQETKFETHRVTCKHNEKLPTIGNLVYWDDRSPFIIRHIKGYADPLFCQNLCLFGKLFLDDKSVYYNVNQFDFYVLYGIDPNELINGLDMSNFKPMGFYSKELLSWDDDNNLACICIFPPYQRMHLGSLLIEFLYQVAKLTPGQYFSGPEFPLSPFGKVSYYNFWAKKLAPIILQEFSDRQFISLRDLAYRTGFRKDDILIALDYMEVLQNKPQNKPQDDSLTLLLGNIETWCSKHKIDINQETSMIKEDCVLL